MAIAAGLLVLVLSNVYSVLGGTAQALGKRNLESDADNQAKRALERIAMAVIGAQAESLTPSSPSPGSVGDINYWEFLGVGDEDADADGKNDPVYSDPMRIGATAEASGDVSWFQNPGTEKETKVTWVKNVPGVAVGETAGNGIDDNENGLVDETGLAFVKEGKSVRIVLSVRISDGKGGFLERQKQTTVTCRN
jgi:hypothetical protein